MYWFLIWVIAFVTGGFVLWALMQILRLKREHKERIIEYMTLCPSLKPNTHIDYYIKANRLAYELMLECSKKEWLAIRDGLGPSVIPYLTKTCGFTQGEAVWHAPDIVQPANDNKGPKKQRHKH